MIGKHNLEAAKPMFQQFIRNMSPKMAQWIQYRGIQRGENGMDYFQFKSSQNSLRFEVYAGVNPRVNPSEAYEFFRQAKLEVINQNHTS